jgi:radical SAM protein with 4Fe4S-binding SPASM domain
MNKVSFKHRIKSFSLLYRTYMALRAIRVALHGIRQNSRGAQDHLHSSFSLLIGSPRVWGRPVNLTIEPTTFCNLECPVCETGCHDLQRPKKNMTLETFSAITDKIAPHINTMLFYFMGEPFINVHSYEMIAYAKSKGIPFITTCTNGDVVDPEKLVASGIDDVQFQIGGMTQKSHSAYRINSNLELVLHNLQETLRIRNQRKSRMRINAGLIVMKPCESEVETFHTVMRKFGVDKAILVPPLFRTIEQARAMLPARRDLWLYDEAAFNRGLLKPTILPYNLCPHLYYSLTVLVNGDVVPCCRDPRGTMVMGNLVKQQFLEFWNGPKFLAFRRNILSNQNNIEICKLCSSYGFSNLQ